MTAYFDQRVGHTAYAAAVRRGERQDRARIDSEKAMIIDGIRRATGKEGSPADPPEKFRVTVDLVELANAVHRLREAAPEQVRTQ